MPLLSGLILMSLWPLLRCHSCQVWYWCVYALLWDAILVRFDIDVFMTSFEMPFLLGLILISLCPLLRCHSCQIWYWCLYALFWDVILIRFDIHAFMPSFEMPFLSGLTLISVCPVLRCHSCQVDIDVVFPILRLDRLQWTQIGKSYIKCSNVVWIFNIVFRRHVTVMWLLRVNITIFVSSKYNVSFVERYSLLINKSQQLL